MSGGAGFLLSTVLATDVWFLVAKMPRSVRKNDRFFKGRSPKFSGLHWWVFVLFPYSFSLHGIRFVTLKKRLGMRTSLPLFLLVHQQIGREKTPCLDKNYEIIIMYTMRCYEISCKTLTFLLGNLRVLQLSILPPPPYNFICWQNPMVFWKENPYPYPGAGKAISTNSRSRFMFFSLVFWDGNLGDWKKNINTHGYWCFSQ